MNALFSPCRTYRYALWRGWATGDGLGMFIGLNPSTADETNDDPTIRRCVGFTRAWGYSRLCMTNLFAYRATDPRWMMAAADPVGPENDKYLLEIANGADVIVAAWGTHGMFRNRDKAVRAMLSNVHYLRLTKGGFPAHPLYLPKHLTPTRYA